MNVNSFGGHVNSRMFNTSSTTVGFCCLVRRVSLVAKGLPMPTKQTLSFPKDFYEGDTVFLMLTVVWGLTRWLRKENSIRQYTSDGSSLRLNTIV